MAKAKKESPPVVVVEPSRCTRCGSTARTGYSGTTEVARAIPGETPEGKPYTHIVWRRTCCRDCGQVRCDKSFENRSKGGKRAC